MTTYYRGKHRTQFDGSPLANQNCTPTTMANGVRCSTGGKIDKSGGEMRALLKRSEEQSPATPGWSLWDVDKACAKINIPYEIRSRREGGWAGVENALADGLFVQLSGDSDQFPNGTCSGVFDGPHSVGLNPQVLDDHEKLLADPICRDWRSERGYILNRYAMKFARKQNFAFGVFLRPVPIIKATPEDTDVLLTVVKGEDWTPTTDELQKPYRDTPDRHGGHILGYIKRGEVVRTISEAETPDGNRWRLTERNGKPAWLLRADFNPVTPGGDPAVDQDLSDYIARK